MIIALRGSREDASKIDAELMHDTIKELVRAHRYGKHIFLVDRQMAEWILDNIPLDCADIALLRRLKSEYTQYGALTETATTHIEIEMANDIGIYRSSSVIFVGFNEIVSKKILDDVVLLIEDISSDGIICEDIVDAVRSDIGIPALNYDLHHGGGSAIKAIIDQKSNDHRIICAVMDSDKRTPHSPKSKTVKNVEALIQRNNLHLVDLVELPCHEIENVIPIEIIDMIDSSGQRAEELSWHRTIISEENKLGIARDCRFWLFFDQKKGLEEEKIAQLPEIEREWYSIHISISSNGKRFLGFGDRVCKQITENADIRIKLKEAIRKDEWQDVFAGSFQKIAWMLAAPRRLRV